MKLDPDKRASYLSFVRRSFRDIADGDYIAARISYRYELGPQFLWAGQQALEKYLKAILLYNDQSTKNLGHDIEKAYRRLSRIKDVPFKIPDDIEYFIQHLNRQGNNRYFEKPAYTTGKELLTLDRVVWHVRKYCLYLHGQTTPGPDGKRINLFPLEIKRINQFPEEKANEYRIFGGVVSENSNALSCQHLLSV